VCGCSGGGKTRYIYVLGFLPEWGEKAQFQAVFVAEKATFEAFLRRLCGQMEMAVNL
jgi:hypothetical protein